MLITVHRNLNVGQAVKKDHLFIPSQPYTSGCLWVITACSEKGTPRGKVVGYRTHIALENAQAKVSEAGHLRTIERQTRSVYARIWGECVHPDDVYGWNFHGNPDLFAEVTFTPGSKGGEPTFYYKETGEPCASWGIVYFTPQGMYVKTAPPGGLSRGYFDRFTS